MVWVIHFCSPVAELNRWLGTQKLLSVDRSAQTRQVHSNSHAYTCIHHRIQLAVGGMTMRGWKPTISLIHPPPPSVFKSTISTNVNYSRSCTRYGISLTNLSDFLNLIFQVYPRSNAIVPQRQIWWCQTCVIRLVFNSNTYIWYNVTDPRSYTETLKYDKPRIWPFMVIQCRI